MKIQDYKSINSILYFANKSPEGKINRLKLMKLIWLADRIHLNKYGRFILKDTYYALPHGPVPSKTMDISEDSIEDVFKVMDYEIIAEDNFESKYFSKSDLVIMSEVWEKFGQMTDIVLRDFSHLFPEWEKFKKNLDDPSSPNRYLMDIDDFFSDPPESKLFQFDEEIKNLSKEIFSHNGMIQEALSK